MRAMVLLVAPLAALAGCTASFWGDTCGEGECHQLTAVAAIADLGLGVDPGAAATGIRQLGFGVAEETAEKVRSDEQGARSILVSLAPSGSWQFEVRYSNITKWTSLAEVEARAGEVQAAQAQDFAGLLAGFEGSTGARHLGEPTWKPIYKVE